VANVTIPSMTLRVTGVLALVLGIGLWPGNADGLKPFHMILGLLVVASLLWLAALFAQAGRGVALAAAAVVVALAQAGLGFSQENILTTGAHWAIQVTHLVLGLAALALGEIMGGRLRRGAAA
jgi:hypothetical protein